MHKGKTINQAAASIILSKFMAQAKINNPFSFREFSRIALFDSDCGYYAKEQERVGRNATTDFFTATSLGSVFGKLVVAAVEKLLPNTDLAAYTLVEIGTEPGKDAFASIDLPFKSKLNIPVGEPLQIPPKAIVFANEVLDAQPFHRLCFRAGRWHEIGVAYRDGALHEALLPQPSAAVGSLLESLPTCMPEPYYLDIALDAEYLLGAIAAQPWTGLLLFMDYGKYWDELLEACPQGTARAYYKHQQQTDLLAQPGDQDLTCHVCWDRLECVLAAHGMESIQVQRQESFFMHHSHSAMQQIIENEPHQFDPERQALIQLVHPTHMGHAFQVLSAKR